MKYLLLLQALPSDFFSLSFNPGYDIIFFSYEPLAEVPDVGLDYLIPRPWRMGIRLGHGLLWIIDRGYRTIRLDLSLLNF
jgi:hypothetical protein